MRSSARPVLLRSLNVIGGATAPSPAEVAAAPFGLCADNEILIKLVLLWYNTAIHRYHYYTRRSACFFAALMAQYPSRQLLSATRPPFQLSADEARWYSTRNLLTGASSWSK